MPIYVTYAKQTQKGAETIKEAPQRLAQAAQRIQQVGGRILGAYATLGRYDYLYIVEMPDNKVGWKVLIQTAMQGTVSTETVEAIPIEEFVKMVGEA